MDFLYDIKLQVNNLCDAKTKSVFVHASNNRVILVDFNVHEVSNG